MPREEEVDSSKKLLKRPTSLEDNDHPSLINDHQPETEKTKTEFFKQNFTGNKRINILYITRNECKLVYIISSLHNHLIFFLELETAGKLLRLPGKFS